jgi:hypothetical protein
MGLTTSRICLDQSGRTFVDLVRLTNQETPNGSSATERTFLSAREHKTLCCSLTISRLTSIPLPPL